MTAPTTTSLDLDPVDVFAKLVREVNAGLALVELQPRDQRRDAALDALVLARDVLDDARELLAPDCDHSSGLRFLDGRCVECEASPSCCELWPAEHTVECGRA